MRVRALLRDARDGVAHACGDRAHRSDLGLEGAKFGRRRLVADEEEVRHLLEGRVLGEVRDLVAAVDELGLGDGADRGVADGLAGEAAGVDWLRGGGGCGAHRELSSKSCGRQKGRQRKARSLHKPKPLGRPR